MEEQATHSARRLPARAFRTEASARRPRVDRRAEAGPAGRAAALVDKARAAEATDSKSVATAATIGIRAAAAAATTGSPMVGTTGRTAGTIGSSTIDSRPVATTGSKAAATADS